MCTVPSQVRVFSCVGRALECVIFIPLSSFRGCYRQKNHRLLMPHCHVFVLDLEGLMTLRWWPSSALAELASIQKCERLLSDSRKRRNRKCIVENSKCNQKTLGPRGWRIRYSPSIQYALLRFWFKMTRALKLWLLVIKSIPVESDYYFDWLIYCPSLLGKNNVIENIYLFWELLQTTQSILI